MITLSVDPHPGSHTVVALDPNGATLASSRRADCCGKREAAATSQFPIHPTAFANCNSLQFRSPPVAGRSVRRFL